MTNRRASLLLIASTTLWGASSAVLAKLGKADGTGAPLLAAGGAATLALVVVAGPARREVRRILRHPTGLLVIGLLEALNLGLYAAALALGPVPVVVALHLTSPILLVALAVLRGRRRVDAVVVLQILLIVSGIVLLGMQPGEGAGSHPLLAGALAVGSAVAVAGLIAAVAKLAPAANPDVAAASQLTIAAVATAPLILAAAPTDQVDAAILLAAGALFLGPGFAIYWRALRGASAATAGILGLNEAVAATIFSVSLFGDSVSLVSGLSGTLVLVAVALEVRRARNGTRVGLAHFSDKL